MPITVSSDWNIGSENEAEYYQLSPLAMIENDAQLNTANFREISESGFSMSTS